MKSQSVDFLRFRIGFRGFHRARQQIDKPAVRWPSVVEALFVEELLKRCPVLFGIQVKCLLGGGVSIKALDAAGEAGEVLSTHRRVGEIAGEG